MNKNNEMILRVLEATNKKDDREAFDYVEKFLGFDVYKDGGFHVVNTANNRKSLYINKENCWYRVRKWVRVDREGGHSSRAIEDYKKIDFYAYLTMPFNKEYQDLLNNKYYGEVRKYDKIRKRLKFAKDWVDTYDKWINEAREELKWQVENLTKKIEGYADRKNQYNEELKDIRKEIELCRG